MDTLQKGDYKKAKDYIQKAIDAEESPSGTLWEHLGDIYFKLGDKDKAFECWQKAKELGTESEEIDRKLKDKVLYE